jgi:indole-3-glycerol phosphate synthase
MKNIDPGTQLYKIIAAKKAYLQEKKRHMSYSQLEQALKSLEPVKGPSFFDVLKSQDHAPKIIAEVKKASPSRGVIRSNLSLSEVNDAYQSISNVVAISILTEKDYFHGSEETLAFFAHHNTNNKPLLRKDFIFDTYQIAETKLLGAQAYLLIASLFEDAEELEELIKAGHELGLEPLVEVHTREELELAEATSARVIGVNCRDMKTLDVDLKVHELLKDIDDAYAKVAESGIETPDYLKHVTGFCDAALVGSHLMEAADIKAAIERLIEPVRSQT